MQVGTTTDQSLYNKPSAAVHPGASAAGTLPQYNSLVVEIRMNPFSKINLFMCLKNQYFFFT